MKFLTGSWIPAVFALLAIAAEFLGPFGLVVGLLTRVAALGIACVMLVAIVTVHWPHGFFMNWSGNQKGKGFIHGAQTVQKRYDFFLIEKWD